jgi:hypothetical protein
MKIWSRSLGIGWVLWGALAVGAGCSNQQSPPESVVSPPPPSPPKDAGSGKPPKGDAASKTPEPYKDVVGPALTPLWKKVPRDIEKADSSKGVLVGIDVAGAQGEMGKPLDFFVNLCAARYACSLTTLQKPEGGSVNIEGSDKAQRADPFKKPWDKLVSDGAKDKTTKTSKWIGEWLARPDDPDVAIIWSDGMVDANNENEIVKAEALKSLSGAWAVIGTFNGRPCLLYVLARNDNVNFGAKVANDLVMAQGTELTLDVTKPIELFPGTGWEGKTTVTLVSGTEAFKKADARVVQVNGVADGKDDVLTAGRTMTVDWPTTITFVQDSNANHKSRALGELAGELAKGSFSLPGIKITLAQSGAWPAALPTHSAVVAEKWTWAKLPKEGDEAYDWGLDPATNAVNPFKGRLPVTQSCAAQDGAYAFGVHDALVVKKFSQPVAQPDAGMQNKPGLESVFNEPTVKTLLGESKGEGCEAKLLVVSTPKQVLLAPERGAKKAPAPKASLLPYFPASRPAEATLNFELKLTNSCKEALLAMDVDKDTLASDIDRKLLACDTPLLKLFKELSGKGAAAAIAKDKGLSIQGKKVTRFYAWHLLHKFAMQLAERSVREFGADSALKGDPVLVPVVRVVVAPSPPANLSQRPVKPR